MSESMIEFRKEFFADERDDRLNEIGRPTRRQDILGHVTGRSPFYDNHLFQGCCTCAARARPITLRGFGRSTPRRRNGARAWCACSPAVTCRPTSTRSSPCLISASMTSRCSGPTACATRASRWRRYRRERGGGARSRCKGTRRVGGSAARARCRGGDPPRCSSGARHLSGQQVHLSREVRPPEAPLRRRGRSVEGGRPRGRRPLPDVADRGGADRDLRRHRRARDQRSVRLLHLDAGAVLLARDHLEAPARSLEPPSFYLRNGGAAGSAARWTPSMSRSRCSARW